jgi:argininosuccinate lyase
MRKGSILTNDYQLWGGRFAAGPDEQMKQLNNSIQFDQQLALVDIRGSLAYAGALAEAGIIAADEAQQLQTGLRAVQAEFEGGTFLIKDSDEDIHTAVERRLGEIVGEVAGKLHTGRSRNDQVATDIRLWLRDACDRTNHLLRDIQVALLEQAEQHLHTLMPGFTHLQPAQPISSAHWLMSFFWMLQRDRERLAQCRQRLNLSPLGASALAGTPYPLDLEKLAAELGFKATTPNSLDAVSDRDSIVEFLFIASLTGLHLSRLAEDIIIYSNPQFDFIRLADAYSTGSSLMPQKRNADPLELARGKTGRLVGNLTGLLTTLKGLPSTYNKDLQEDKEPLFDTVTTLERLLPVMAGLIRTMTFNPAKMRAALLPAILATELADWLVQKKNLPFRQAHHLVGQAVRLAEEKATSLAELTLENYQSISPLFEADLFSVLNFESAVARRNNAGGTAPAVVQRQLEQAWKLLPV